MKTVRIMNRIFLMASIFLLLAIPLMGIGSATVNWHGMCYGFTDSQWACPTGALFLLVGMLYERTHERSIPKLGGFAHLVPVYAVCLSFFAMASLGLPGLAGFVGEFLILVGAWAYAPALAGLAALGVILGAAYLLWMLQRVLFGELPPAWAGVRALGAAEVVCLLPLVLLTVWIGVFPGPFLRAIESSLPAILGRIGWL